MFEVIGILTKDGEQFRKKLGRTAYKKSPHYRRFKADPSDASWIFKGSKKSILFPIAVPLTRKDIENLYEIKPTNSSQTETAQVSSYTRSAREVVNTDHLRKMSDS